MSKHNPSTPDLFQDSGLANAMHNACIAASQKDMAARIAYRAEPCDPESAPEGWGQNPDCYGSVAYE